jgi:hypothetical protein
MALPPLNVLFRQFLRYSPIHWSLYQLIFYISVKIYSLVQINPPSIRTNYSAHVAPFHHDNCLQNAGYPGVSNAIYFKDPSLDAS